MCPCRRTDAVVLSCLSLTWGILVTAVTAFPGGFEGVGGAGQNRRSQRASNGVVVKNIGLSPIVNETGDEIAMKYMLQQSLTGGRFQAFMLENARQ